MIARELPAWRSLLFVPVVREKFVAGAHRYPAGTMAADASARGGLGP